MAAPINKAKFTQDINAPIKAVYGGGLMFNKDNLSNVISVDIVDGGLPFDVTGTVSGTVIRSDGTTVPVNTGAISGNTVSLTLTEACFDVPGQIVVNIIVTNGDVKCCVLRAVYTVVPTETSAVVDPGDILPSIADLINDIDAAVASIPADYSGLLASITGTFSASTAYSAGAYVWYDGTLYRFTAAHAAGSWTGSDATAVTIGGELVDLKSAVDEFNPLKTYLFEQGNYSTIAVGQQLNPQNLAYVVRTKEFAEWSAGKYISVKAGYKARLLLCDSNGNYIVDAPWAQNATSNNSTATQVMVCIKSDDNSALTPDMVNDIVLYSTINITVVYAKANQSDFTALKTIVDGIVENGQAGVYNRINITPVSGVMNKTGTIANIGQHASVSVTPGEKYEIIAYKYSNDYPAYIFRKDGSIVGYSENATQMYRRWLVAIPSGVDEMIVNANTYLLYVAKYQTVTPMPYSKWHGKKIAWFGTSIPEPSGYNPVIGYPEYVGELLGATVYNEAVGSSCARRGTRSAESADDPYGVTNMGIGALWSLGGTIAEKTELTTNWETKWRAITGYDVAMTDAIKDKAIACSYENKLMQYVTTNPADLYVFDHGYNDWRANSADNVANPDDPFDRATYQGAMNTFIAAILAVNPHANIVLISHYETQREPGVIDMQESVAEYWGLPLIRICDKLGWAWDRTITSEGYWQSTSGGGIWIESGGSSRSYHLPELHMQDGKHPNTDLSGKACMDIGNIIAAELNMLPPHK